MGEMMTVRTSIKWRGREVQNPVLRKLLGSAAILLGLLSLCWWLVCIVFVFAMSPLLVPLHFALKAVGRRGFVAYKDDGTFVIEVSRRGFKRV